jgi:hypothetical protein
MTRQNVLTGYLIFVGAVFYAMFELFQVREFGLYIGLGVLNFPASLVVLPVSEVIAGAMAIRTGSEAHVWGVQAASMALNSLVIVWVPRIIWPAKKSAD